jgi:AcrR family transcriptional regulator
MGRGLTPATVADTAARLADRDGFDTLTLGAVAAELGVRTPSLYNHVEGLAGVRRAIALRGLQELGEAIRDAAVGRSADDAVIAVAAAYRSYAGAHPGVYAALQRAPDPGDAELESAAARVLEPIFAVLRGYGVEGDDAVHAARALRSALHGFVDLERAGGFGLDLDLDESYRRSVAVLAAGLRGGWKKLPEDRPSRA